MAFVLVRFEHLNNEHMKKSENERWMRRIIIVCVCVWLFLVKSSTQAEFRWSAAAEAGKNYRNLLQIFRFIAFFLSVLFSLFFLFFLFRFYLLFFDFSPYLCPYVSIKNATLTRGIFVSVIFFCCALLYSLFLSHSCVNNMTPWEK